MVGWLVGRRRRQEERKNFLFVKAGRRLIDKVQRAADKERKNGQCSAVQDRTQDEKTRIKKTSERHQIHFFNWNGRERFNTETCKI